MMKFKAVLVEEPFKPPQLTVMPEYAVDNFVKSEWNAPRMHFPEIRVFDIKPHWAVRISHSVTPAEAENRGGRW